MHFGQIFSGFFYLFLLIKEVYLALSNGSYWNFDKRILRMCMCVCVRVFVRMCACACVHMKFKRNQRNTDIILLLLRTDLEAFPERTKIEKTKTNIIIDIYIFICRHGYRSFKEFKKGR